MSVIFDYIDLEYFKENYEKYGEIVFELFLHNGLVDRAIPFELLRKNNNLLDSEHKVRLFNALAYNSNISYIVKNEFKTLSDDIKNKYIDNIRKFGNMSILDRYIDDLEEHDICLICAKLDWLSYALIKSKEKNFKKIVEYLFTNSLEEVLNSNKIQLFSGNTAERREYIANELIKIVDVRILILLVNSNCMNDIANTYRQKHINYFISEMENYDDVVLYRFIRLFRKNKLPDIVEKKLLDNNRYMCFDAAKCKTICTKNTISSELKSKLYQFMKSQYVLKKLNI